LSVSQLVSPLAEVIEEVWHRRIRCQRRHLAVNDDAPSGDYRRRSGFASLLTGWHVISLRVTPIILFFSTMCSNSWDL